jgi:hypothetical protein
MFSKVKASATRLAGAAATAPLDRAGAVNTPCKSRHRAEHGLHDIESRSMPFDRCILLLAPFAPLRTEYTC